MEEDNDITIIKPADTFLQLFIRNLLPLGVFSLKFLEWWYSAERSTTVKMMTSLPVPPLPNTMKVHVQICPHASFPLYLVILAGFE